tara:strand:+ start:836 stop:1012 length:177 start_codon:yes stop_codon:yes gene_type:complete
MVVGKIVAKGAWWGGKKVAGAGARVAYGAVSSSGSKKPKLKLRHSRGRELFRAGGQQQ